MVKQDRYYGVDRYLPHAVLATASVVVIPSLLVVALLLTLDGGLAPVLAAVVGGALALAVAGIGSVMWSRGPGALDVSFGELLIWGWVRRKRAEERAARDARLLGLDQEGRPTDHARSARAQQLAILGDLSTALESKDPYTHGHSQRVERHAIRTAMELGFTIEQIADLRRAAALHDVGKIRIPHRILRKPGTLSHEERRIIEQHPVVGAWLVSNVCSSEIVAAVRNHHERWDGRGYPDRLSGHNIPLYARVIAVADAFDAMTSTRPYRVAYDSRTAVEILEAEAGAQFDPEVVRAFVATVPNRVPLGAFAPIFGLGALRKIAAGARRALSGTAVSGAVGAGTAAVLVASVMSPVQSPLANPNRGDVAAPLYGPAAPDITLELDGTEASRARKTDARSVGDESERKRERRDGEPHARPGTDVVLGSRVTRSSNDGDATLPDDGDEAPSPRDGSGGEPTEPGRDPDDEKQRGRDGKPGDGDTEPDDDDRGKGSGPTEPSSPPKEEDPDDDEDPLEGNGQGKGHTKHSDKGQGKSKGKGHQKYDG